MSLTGVALPIVLGAVALVLLGLIVCGRPTCRRRRVGMAARGGMSIAFTASVLALVASLLNNEYAFYTSWSDLLGAPSEPTVSELGADAAAAARAVPPGQGLASLAVPASLPALPTPGNRMQKYVLPMHGGAAGHKVFVHLPEGYDPASTRTYPVIVAMHGLPGSPESYNKLGRFYDKIDAAVAAGAMRAPIVVVPQLNANAHADSECVDVPGGAQTETWLARDLPRWVVEHFRADTARTAWATWGYSFGGWCATMLAMKHPDVYASAVAYQGYFSPQFDGKAPFPKDSPQWRSYDLIALERRSPQPVSLWLFACEADPTSYPSTRAFLDAVKAPTSVTSRVGKAGGHRLSVWTRKIPHSLAWLGSTQPGFAPSASTERHGGGIAALSRRP